MFETKTVPTCHFCGSQEIRIDDRPGVQSYRTREGTCQGCGYIMWVYSDGSTWIPGVSDRIEAEMEADADD